MRPILSLPVLVLLLAGCGGGSPSGGGSSLASVPSLGGTCPSPDPVRDGPLVDAIRTGNTAPIDAALARDPADERALAAQAIVTRRGNVDPSQAACFEPYL